MHIQVDNEWLYWKYARDAARAMFLCVGMLLCNYLYLSINLYKAATVQACIPQVHQWHWLQACIPQVHQWHWLQNFWATHNYKNYSVSTNYIIQPNSCSLYKPMNHTFSVRLSKKLNSWRLVTNYSVFLFVFKLIQHISWLYQQRESEYK